MAASSSGGAAGAAALLKKAITLKRICLWQPFFLLARSLAGWLLTLRIRNRNARLRAAVAGEPGRCLARKRVCLLNVH